MPDPILQADLRVLTNLHPTRRKMNCDLFKRNNAKSQVKSAENRGFKIKKQPLTQEA